VNDLEHRLNAAFTALADTVDEQDQHATSRPASRSRGSTRPVLVAAAAAGAALVIGGAIFALRPTPGTTSPAAKDTTTNPSASSFPISSPPPPSATPYRLYTHCGIDEAKIGATFYEAVTPLHDGAHNPPAGWGNPYQEGTMTITSATEAVFRDDKGHEVVFRVRPGATKFKQICQ
jgi:hypothetical protein